MVLLVSGSSANHMQMRPQEASFLAATAVVGGRDLPTCTRTHVHSAAVHISSCQMHAQFAKRWKTGAFAT